MNTRWPRIGLYYLVAAAIGIGFVADRTGSILAAAAFHFSGNITGTSTDFRALIPQHERLVLVGCCIAVLLVVLRIWRANDARLSRPAEQA